MQNSAVILCLRGKPWRWWILTTEAGHVWYWGKVWLN